MKRTLRLISWTIAAVALGLVIGFPLMGMLSKTVAPNDVPDSHVQYQAIRAVVERQLMVGTGDGRFEPDRAMTRCEAAVVMVKLAGGKPGEGGDWCGDWLYSAINMGLMPEMTETEALGTLVTRGDMAVILYLGGHR